MPESNLRKIKWPEQLTTAINEQLSLLSYNINNLQKLVPAIIKQSNSYNNDTNIDPWATKVSQAAYLSYFFPLNTLRLIAVIEEAQKLGFFKGIKTATELGSGCGTFDMAYRATNNQPLVKTNIELSDDAVKIHKSISTNLNTNNNRFSDSIVKSDLFIASYTLNETGNDISKLASYDNLFIIEPSTDLHSRNLMKLREQLLKEGFYA